MELKGTQHIAAPREKVWAALNDPEVLKACIPGCQELNTVGENGFEAKVKAKVGPVSATFEGSVELSNINAPNSYTISGEGKGGVAGFAKGGADVSLSDDGGATVLEYAVKAQVGGKLAQMGARLIDGTAKKMSSQFFQKFGELVESDGTGTQEVAPAATSETASTPTAAPVAEQSASTNSSSGDHKKWLATIAVALAALWLITTFAG